MGKASKFFRSLLGFKTSETAAPPPSRSDPNKQPKRRWSFVKSHRDKPHHDGSTSDSFDASLSRARDTPIHHRHHSSGGGYGIRDQSKHSIAVAAAKAAVAEAVVATAQAAAEVVRMTSRTTGTSAGYSLREERAAVKIQSFFRAYLARRALKALKGLVKLQALVRGHILRKRTTNMMRRLQVLIRAQARARAGRSLIVDSPKSTSKGSSYFHHNGPPTPEKFDHGARSTSTKYDHPSILKKNGSKSYARAHTRTYLDDQIDDEKNDKILEIDTGKPHITPRRRTLFQQDQISQSYSQSLTSKGSTVQQPNRSPSEEEVSFCSPAKVNSSMRLGPFTPAKSESSRSCISGYSDHPNYMAYTESSRAKVRSLSAPRQRPQFEGSGSMKRYSVYGYGSGVQPISMSFASKAYPGSGRLDRLGMPVGGVGSGESEFSGYYWN